MSTSARGLHYYPVDTLYFVQAGALHLYTIFAEHYCILKIYLFYLKNKLSLECLSFLIVFPQKNEGDWIYSFSITHLNTDVKTAMQLQLSSGADSSLISTITLWLFRIDKPYYFSLLLPLQQPFFIHTQPWLFSPTKHNSGGHWMAQLTLSNLSLISPPAQSPHVTCH